ncbi:long-chain fatty acid--CoA ligase [bacterium]|nr:long-chain fatty acid--CoA ligase [bacterium]
MSLNLYTTLAKAAEKFPKKKAVFYENSVFSFSEVIDKIDRFAGLLTSRGIKKGDNVAVLLRNSPELIYSFFACWKIGAAVVPLNFFYTSGELIYILNDSRALILVSNDSFAEHFTRIKEEVNNIKEIISWDNQELPEKQHGGEKILPEDTAAILYTSGTTGHPKGAILTHKNFLSDVASCRAVVAVNHKDRAICFLPLFHSFALTVCLLLPILQGGSVVLLPRIIKGPKFLKLIFKRRITLFVSIPQVYSLFADIPSLIGRIALWSVNYFVSGADSLPVAVLVNFEKKFHKKVLEGYGLTEAAPVVTFNPPELRKPGYIGKALPGIEVKIVSVEGKELSSNEVGEIIIKGDNVMQGYFQYPEATKTALRGGWLYSGDIGFKDEDGYIKIMDRKNDMFVCRGLNVYPREIENVLRELPQIEEAAVKGIQLKEDTKVPVAYIKIRSAISAPEIIAFCRGQLANYKVPHHINFLEDFPRTATGKISKKDLS